MQKTKNDNIETYLPVFSGFYETIWQFQDENEIYLINEERKNKGLNPIDYDNLHIDYSQYEYDICKNLCKVICEKLKLFINSIKMQKIHYPKQYNFANNSVDILVSANTDKIKEYIYENIEAYKEYLKNMYTGYDGYIPHYSNKFDDWKEYTQDFSDFSGSGHYLGSILEFICEMEGITEYEIYEEVKTDIYEGNYILNYDEVINGYTCSKCNQIIKNENSVKDIEKYKSMTNKNPSIIHCENCIN